MRLIDADVLQVEYKKRHDGKRLLLIDVAPTIEPERKKGKWERNKDGVYCSVCYLGWNFITGVPVDIESKYRFCPNCGADMREDAE